VASDAGRRGSKVGSDGEFRQDADRPSIAGRFCLDEVRLEVRNAPHPVLKTLMFAGNCARPEAPICRMMSATGIRSVFSTRITLRIRHLDS